MASIMMKYLGRQLAKNKKKTRDIVTSDEELAAKLPSVRKGNDDMIAKVFKCPKQISIESRSMGEIPGEYYVYDDNDADKKKDTFLMYIHGGGFENGTASSRKYIAATLAKEIKADGFSVEYTQWPEGRFEQGLKEVYTVYKSILAAGYSSEKVFIAGESA